MSQEAEDISVWQLKHWKTGGITRDSFPQAETMYEIWSQEVTKDAFMIPGVNIYLSRPHHGSIQNRLNSAHVKSHLRITARFTVQVKFNLLSKAKGREIHFQFRL